LTGENIPRNDQWERLSVLLEVPVEELKALAKKDYEAVMAEMDAFRALDPRYYLDIRIVGFICKRVYFPGDLTVEQAVAASKPELDKLQPREFKLTAAYLSAPDNSTYILDSNGKCYGRIHGPGCWTSIGGKAVNLVFS
jgi:hypothetical protein